MFPDSVLNSAGRLTRSLPSAFVVQPLLHCRTVALDPAPDCRGVCLQAALAEQLFDIAEREQVPQLPAHGAKNQFGLGLSPLEDRGSDCLFHDLFSFPVAVGQSFSTPETSSFNAFSRYQDW